MNEKNRRQGDKPTVTEFNNNSGAAPQQTKQQLITDLKNKLKLVVSGNNFTTIDDEELTPTPNQKHLMKLIEDKDVVLVNGPAGTGKTIWSAYMALSSLIEKKCTKIAVTAPAVEAGEEIGFVPGGKDEKMYEYVNQMLESFDDWIGKDLREKLQNAGIINIESHAFMRGRTIKNTFFLFDECQNASGPNLITAITRLGIGSKFVFMGDDRQNDRTNGTSAFVAFTNRLSKPAYANFVGVATMSKQDIRRHPFLLLMAENGDDGPLTGFENHKSGNGVRVAPVAPSAPALG